MEIITQTIDTKKRLIDYICDELRRCIHLQPCQESKINLSLDTTKPEFIRVSKDEDEGMFLLDWIMPGHNIAFDFKIPTGIEEMAHPVRDMVLSMNNIAEKDAFEQKCYELYQLEWMMSHGYSLDDLYKAMLKYEKEMFDPEDFGDGKFGNGHVFDASDLERSAMEARDTFLFEQGFGNSQIFANKREFLDVEYQDASYMKWLFETQVDTEAARLKELYRKHTGRQLSCIAELKVHTESGMLKAYRCTDPEHPGIAVMLQPKGHDIEIDVTMAESDGKNINIVNWGDATTEDSTHRETLLWDDIESTLPKVYSGDSEELKKLILDEWIKFTFGQGVTEGEIDNIPQDLLDEIAFRCDSLETDDITRNIRACLEYAKDKGNRAFIKEMDDCNIWSYIG